MAVKREGGAQCKLTALEKGVNMKISGKVEGDGN